MPEEKKEILGEDIVIEESSDDVSGIKTDTVKKLKEKLKKCLEERKEYLDGWQRMKADSINLKKEEEKKTGRNWRVYKRRYNTSTVAGFR